MCQDWKIRHYDLGVLQFEPEDEKRSFFKGQSRHMHFFLLLPNYALVRRKSLNPFFNLKNDLSTDACGTPKPRHQAVTSTSISENVSASTLFVSETLSCSDPWQVESVFK
jgi:hypothetical protein